MGERDCCHFLTEGSVREWLPNCGEETMAVAAAACVRMTAGWPGKSSLAAVCSEGHGVWREEACPGGLGFLQLVAWSW